MKAFVKSVADKTLEATIIGSFTKIGAIARSRLYDMKPVASDLSGQRAVITGATSGIGQQTAYQLLRLGATVAITSRSSSRAEKTAEEFNSQDLRGSAVPFSLDTSDFDSVKQFARAVRQLGPLDMLLHNAGALLDTYQTNKQGIELTLASHLLGPYLLTRELQGNVTSGARVIWMSSGGMYTQGLDLDSLEMSAANYKGAVAYAKAKRAQVELVSYLAPQWAPAVSMHAMHPGWVDTPGVTQSLPGFGSMMKPLLRNTTEGADTMVWLAATGGQGQAPGQFWHDRKPRRTSYLPGTSASYAQKKALVAFLDSVLGQ